MTTRSQPSNGQSGPTAPPADDKWDEARYEASLKQLHELHVKLRKLRATIPRMIEPVTESHSPDNPEDMFVAFKQSVSGGIQDVKDFKAAMTDEGTVKIMEKAKQSRQKNPLGIKPWRPRDDPNWTKMDLD